MLATFKSVPEAWREKFRSNVLSSHSLIKLESVDMRITVYVHLLMYAYNRVWPTLSIESDENPKG